jgi:hypothetical protein
MPTGLPSGRFLDRRGDWGVRLVVAWTVVVAGALIVLEVSIALSPDDGFISNAELEFFGIFVAVGVWMIGLTLGVVVFSIVGFLVDRNRERSARAQQSRLDGPDLP